MNNILYLFCQARNGWSENGRGMTPKLLSYTNTHTQSQVIRTYVRLTKFHEDRDKSACCLLNPAPCTLPDPYVIHSYLLNKSKKICEISLRGTLLLEVMKNDLVFKIKNA